MRNYHTIFLLGLTLTLWASTFVVLRPLVQIYSPQHLAVLRFLIASLVLLIIVLFRPFRRPSRSDLPGLSLAGLFGFAVFNLAVNYSEIHISAGSASFLVNTVPLFTALLAVPFLKERLGLLGWVGIGVGLLGSAVILLGNSGGLEINRGSLAVLGAAMAQAVYFIIQKTYLGRFTPLEFTTYTIWFGTGFLLTLSPGLIGAVQSAPISSTVMVAYLGIFPAALGYIIWSKVLLQIPATKAVSTFYLIPIITIVMAWFWLREIPSLLVILGGLITLLGVLLVNSRKSNLSGLYWLKKTIFRFN